MKKETVYAQNKYVRSSARKARLVADMIRGENALKAVDLLKFTNKGVATDISKTLSSAINNAVNNKGLDKKKLYVSESFVNEAPTFKRGRAVGRGRYHQILKRNCHIIIGVQEK